MGEVTVHEQTTATATAPPDRTTHADAHRIAGLGWFVFPLAGKVPTIKRGYSVGFDPTEALAPWAQEHVRHKGTRWWLDPAGPYWATRDPRLIDTLFGHALRVRGGYEVGITSDRLVIDIDEPALVPPDIAPVVARLPNLRTPSGGQHYFAAVGTGDYWQVGGLHDGEGRHCGDLKHLQGAGYSVAYNDLPAYAECDARPDPRVTMWLRDARKQRAQPVERQPRGVDVLIAEGVLGPHGGAWLRPSTFRSPGSIEPDDLEGVERGRHDVINRVIGCLTSDR